MQKCRTPRSMKYRASSTEAISARAGTPASRHASKTRRSTSRTAALLAGTADAQRVVARPPLNHVYALDREDLVERLDGGVLLDHDRDDGVGQHLKVVRRAEIRGQDVAARANAEQPSVLRRVRRQAANAVADVVRRPRIGEQHALESRCDAALGIEAMPFPVELDHRSQGVELGRTAQLLEPGQVERRILRQDLDVVECAGPPDRLNHYGIGEEQMRADRRLAGLEQRPDGVGLHASVLCVVWHDPRWHDADRDGRAAFVEPGSEA